MKNAIFVPALAFVVFIAVTLFFSDNGNAQFFSIILLILTFLVRE